jgi:proline iminopeptidase
MLVMGGAYDWIFSVDELRAIADAVPGAELAVFDDSGHFPWIEEPEEFFSALEDWLAKLP